jgi:aminoglycoside phosphotransferase (APT) family kinase protein
MRTPNHLYIKKTCRNSIEGLMRKHQLGSPNKIVVDETGWVNPCIFVNDTWVFRFNARDPDLPKYQREKFAFDLLQNTKVPVPSKVILDDSKDIAPYDVLISALIPGRNLETDWPRLNGTERSALARKAGEIFAELSSIDLPKFGELGGSGPLSQTDTWEGYLEAKLSFHLNEALVLGIFDKSLIEQFWSAFRSRLGSLAEVRSPKLVHVDYHLGNLLYQNNSIIGVVDFEWSFAGDPLYDLCRWFQQDEEWPGSRSDFLRGCKKEQLTVNEKERMALYQMIRNVELCIVAKLHFDEAEARSFRETTLKQLGTLS